MEMTNFIAALDRLKGAGTERELAQRLGISVDTLQDWRRQPPKSIRSLMPHPSLLRAITQDSEAYTRAATEVS